MPTLQNPNHYCSLLSSVNDFTKWSGVSLENNPGFHIGHISVNHNGYLILLSGFRGYKDQKLCTGETSDGDIPLERSGASGTVIGNHLYMFGGYSEDGNLNSLHRLNLHNLQWRQLQPAGNAPLPCDKNVCWEYDEKLYLFAGYGRGPDPAQWRGNISYQFLLDGTSHWHYLRGWNSQFVCYDPKRDTWEWPQCTGTVPVARAAHAAAKVGHRVFVFGGRNGRIRMNDMYVLDMERLEWTQIMANEENHPVKGRSWHTLTPLSLGRENMLVLYGGFSMDNHPLTDCWLFNTDNFTWTEVSLPLSRPRLWHSAILSSFGEILICGGAVQNIALTVCRQHSRENIFAKDMFSVQFQPKSLFRLCLGAAATNEALLRRFWNELPHNLQSILYQRCMVANMAITAEAI